MLLFVKKKQCPLAAWGTTGQGAPRPLYPHARGIAPGPFLRCRRLLFQTSFRMFLGETKREPTGAMKTKKRADERIYSLTASFLPFSPDAQASGWRCSTAQPVGRVAVPLPIRNAIIVACNRVSAWRQCRSQFAKKRSSSAKECVRVTRFHRESVCLMQIAISGNGSRGNAPGGVWGNAP